jgi:hypothetical protein
MAIAGCVVPDDQRTFRLDLVAVADPDVGAGQHELPRCHSADRGDRLIVIVMVESFGQTRKEPARIMKSVEVLAAADRLRGRMAVQALKRYLDVLLELGPRIPRRRRGEVAACGEIAVRVAEFQRDLALAGSLIDPLTKRIVAAVEAMIGGVVEANQAPLLGRQTTIGISGDSSDRSPEVVPENLGGPDKLRIVALKQTGTQQEFIFARNDLWLRHRSPPGDVDVETTVQVCAFVVPLSVNQLTG